MNKVHFSSEKVEWGTPQNLFDSLNYKHKFNLDVCASSENAKCTTYFTPEQDGLKQPWYGTCWMNPPYGKEISTWLKKAHNESQKGVIIVALLPVRTDTKWFHNWIYNKPGVSIEFLSKRLKFQGSNNMAPFPNMIVIFDKKLNK